MGLSDLYWFVGVFILVYLFYLIFGVLRRKKINFDRIPIELILLIKKYRLDMSKIGYFGIMNFIALVSAFDIAFTTTFVCHYIEKVYLAILIGACMLVPLILITFKFIGLYYVKKGCVIDGNKKNRKKMAKVLERK